jgi:hypothetical protein
MKATKRTHSKLDKISQRAMKIQVVSHRIEGIVISNEVAENIQ